MKGVINKGIQEFLETRFGRDVWVQVKELARCTDPFFSASEDYADQLTLDLVTAAANVTGLPAEEVMVGFGRFWIPHTGAAAYPSFFRLAGPDPRSFLLNMNRVHEHVTRAVSHARPPHFDYENLPGGGLNLHYRSSRRLCAVLRGLIMGVGDHFEQPLHVTETRCVQDGAPHCTMEVRFDGV